MGVDVTIHGPLFDGAAPKVIERFTDDFEQEFAQHSVNRIQARLRRVLRHRTGRYERSITTDLVAGDRVVTDGTSYGPWLEGTSSRNRRSRFKGYQTFRRVTQELDAEAADFAEDLFRRKYLDDLS